MEVDGDDKEAVVSRSTRRRVNSFASDIGDEEVVSEFDVVVCDDLSNTDMCCVQFPKRRQKVFEAEMNPRLRYKKNVRLMEMRFSPNTTSGSYERSKMEKPKSESPTKSPVKPDPSHLLNDEVFEGRAYRRDNASQNFVGIARNGALYLNPVGGIFNMHKIIRGQVSSGKKDEDEDPNLDSDSDAPSSSKPVRVKFTRPETERQKKRREASALHRERLIASDHWLPMKVHLKKDREAEFKVCQMIPKDHSGAPVSGDVTAKDLAQIICGKVEQLDLTKNNKLMSYLRIQELPLHLQVKAQVMKARVISTSDVARLVEGIQRPELISALRECAHLVQGVWVLRSEHLFAGIPPAHCNVPGKVDENRSILWRNARDLSLCLLSAGHRVNRLTLSRCFKLNTIDAEEVLSTVGTKAVGKWELLLPPDNDFLNSSENAALILEERHYWSQRFDELKSLMQTE